MRSLTLDLKVSFSIISIFLIISSNNCGLILTGTDAGKEFAGLSDSKKQDASSLLAAFFGVSGDSSLLVFNPSILNLTADFGGNYEVGFRNAVPSTWANDEVSVSIDLDYSSCPSESFVSPAPVTFDSPYSSQSVTATAHSPGSCVIIHTIGQATSTTSGLTVGTVVGILPVTIAPNNVQVGF